MLSLHTCDRFCLKFSWERFSPSLYCHIYCYILILDHITCNVFTAQCLKADCTIIVMSSRACTAVLYTVHTQDIVTRTGWHRGHASDATDVEKWMIRAVNHHLDTWTSQSECRDHSVSGPSDRHWFKWPQSDNSNLTRQALSRFPTHFYLISHLLSKMMSQSSEVIVIGIIIIIVKSNHLDMIVFHLR